jgi:hypothetical protein
MSDFSNYGLEELLAYLMPPQTGDPTKAGQTYDKNLLDIQAKQTNLNQDMLWQLFQPSFGMLTGTYDPMLTLPQEQQVPEYVGTMPIASVWLNSPNQVVREVAEGLVAAVRPATDPETGQAVSVGLDPASALTRLTEEAEMDTESAQSMIDAVLGDAAKYETGRVEHESKYAAVAPEKRDDAYAKAGLPSPAEEYTLDTLPGNDPGLLGGLAEKSLGQRDALARLDARQRDVRAGRETLAGGGPFGGGASQGRPASKGGGGGDTFGDAVIGALWDSGPIGALRGVDPNAQPAAMKRWIQPQVEERDPAARLALNKAAAKDTAIRSSAYKKSRNSREAMQQELGAQMGRLGAAKAQGRSPLQDALMQRLMALGVGYK